MLPDIQLDDVIRLRKPHPCGSMDWIVVRIGADIGLKCLGCDRKILLPRREVARRTHNCELTCQAMGYLPIAGTGGIRTWPLRS